MQPRRTRTIALVAGAIAVALFALLAPIAWDPTHRLSSLYATSSDETVAEVRPFELRPTVMGPAITSEVLMRLEEDALHMPGIEVSVTPEGEEVVHPPEG